MLAVLGALNAAIVAVQHTKIRPDVDVPGVSGTSSFPGKKDTEGVVVPRSDALPAPRVSEVPAKPDMLKEALDASITYFRMHARDEIPALQQHADAHALCTFNDNWYRNTKTTIDGLPTHKHLEAAWAYIESRGQELDSAFVDGLKDAGRIVGDVNAYVNSIPFGKSVVGTFPTDPTGIRSTITGALAKTPKQKSSCGMMFNSLFEHLKRSGSAELISHAVSKMMLGILTMLRQDIDVPDRKSRATEASFHLLAAIEAALPVKR